MIALEQHAWPGNVRELENKIKTALVMADGDRITADDLSLSAGDGEDGEKYLNLKEVRSRAEATAVNRAVSLAHGNLSRAAELLGISRPTLYDLMAKHDVVEPAESNSFD